MRISLGETRSSWGEMNEKLHVRDNFIGAPAMKTRSTHAVSRS